MKGKTIGVGYEGSRALSVSLANPQRLPEKSNFLKWSIVTAHSLMEGVEHGLETVGAVCAVG